MAIEDLVSEICYGLLCNLKELLLAPRKQDGRLEILYRLDGEYWTMTEIWAQLIAHQKDEAIMIIALFGSMNYRKISDGFWQTANGMLGGKHKTIEEYRFPFISLAQWQKNEIINCLIPLAMAHIAYLLLSELIDGDWDQLFARNAATENAKLIKSICAAKDDLNLFEKELVSLCTMLDWYHKDPPGSSYGRILGHLRQFNIQ